MESVELPKKRKARQEALERLRAYLKAKWDMHLDSEEFIGLDASMSRMEALGKVLLGHFRGGRDGQSDEDIELIVGTADRVAKVVEAVRQLVDWLEFGVPGKDTRREVEDAQLAIYACELHHYAGLTWPEVAE